MGLMSGFIGHRDQYVLAVSLVEMLKPEQFALKLLQESCSPFSSFVQAGI